MSGKKKLNKPLLNMLDVDQDFNDCDKNENYNSRLSPLSSFSTNHDTKNLVKCTIKASNDYAYIEYLKSKIKLNKNCKKKKYSMLLDKDKSSKISKDIFFNKFFFSYEKEKEKEKKKNDVINGDFKIRVKYFNKHLKHDVYKIYNGQDIQYSLQTHELLKMVHQMKKGDTSINSTSGLVQYRDIRKLLSSNTNTRYYISPQRHYVLLNFPYRKCIIFKDFLLYIPTFTNSSINEIAQKEEKVFKRFIENAKMISLIKDSLPFEILILEAIFVDICEELKSEIEPVICEAEKLFEIISDKLSVYKCINKLTDMRKKLKIIDEKVQNTYKSIHDILNNDEDVRRLEVSYFWDKPELWEKLDPTPNNQDTEMLLEYYCHEIEEFIKMINRTDESLDDVLQMVELNLDDARNNVLKLELGLKVYGIIITVVGTIAAIFGMNLKNGFENNSYAFWGLFFFLIVVTVFCLFYALLSFKKVKI